MIKFLRHLFIPHASNNHRAKILHPDSIITIAALVFFSFSLLSAAQRSYPSVLGIAYKISPIDLLNITNQIRKQNNLSPLGLDTELSQAAANKATDMFKKNYWAHIAPDGVTPWVFIKNSGYDYLYAGENLARGFTDPKAVVDAWMASPTHRENMLSANYTDVGFAVADGSLTGTSTVLVVEELGSRYNSAASKAAVPEILTANISSAPPIEISQVPVASNNSGANNQVDFKSVAAIQQVPLIDSNNFVQNISIGLVGFFIVVLIIDAIIIKRKNIERVISHNIDHIFYLIIILLAIIIIGKGVVL